MQLTCSKPCSLLLGMLLLVSSPAWSADCETSTSVSTIMQASARIELAFVDQDLTGLMTNADDALAALVCLDEPLSPHDIAPLYRGLGIGQFVSGGPDSAKLFFAASRALQPGYTLPDSLAPEGHPLRALFEASQTEPGTRTALLDPSEGWLQIDGVRATDVPEGVPYLFQRFDKTGKVVETALVNPGQALPEYPVKGRGSSSTADADPTGVEKPKKKQSAAKVVGWIIEGVVVGVAVGALANGRVTESAIKSRLTNGESLADEEQEARKSANTSYAVGYGALGAGGLLGAGLVVVPMLSSGDGPITVGLQGRW